MLKVREIIKYVMIDGSIYTLDVGLLINVTNCSSFLTSRTCTSGFNLDLLSLTIYSTHIHSDTYQRFLRLGHTLTPDTTYFSFP